MKERVFSRVGAIIVFSCAAIGTLYSGILTYGKLTTGMCVFGSSCPLLLGIPVCVFGFFGFLSVLLLFGASYYTKRWRSKGVVVELFWISLVGTLFALYFLIQELFFIPGASEGFPAIGFGYPSCLYGMVLFGIIFLISRYALTHSEDNL